MYITCGHFSASSRYGMALAETHYAYWVPMDLAFSVHSSPLPTWSAEHQALHGEQYVELKKPFPTEGECLHVHVRVHVHVHACTCACAQAAHGISTEGVWSLLCLCAGTVLCEGRLVDVLDKKSGAVILVNGEWGRECVRQRVRDRGEGREGKEEGRKEGWRH